MTLTAEQSVALVEEIAAAPSSEALEELPRRTRREYGLEMLGSFAEILIDLRRTSLARVSRTRVS